VALVLASKGADPTIADRMGIQPLVLAAHKGLLPMLELFRER
jgi:ankyrin repeat protein